MRSYVLSSMLAGLAAAAGGPYAQCGGNGWTGDTTCVSGYVCEASSEWYAQCRPGTAAATTTTTTLRTTTKVSTTTTKATVATTTTKAPVTTTTTTTKAPTTTGTSGKLKWLGINLSVAEFGTGNYPGTYGVHFNFPDQSAITTLLGQGYNTFRVAFAMERLVPDKLTNPAAAAYLKNLTSTVDFITSKGAYAILDPHNFGRYYGNVISDVDGFGSFWKTVATSFKSNPLVIFDTNNEYHDMDQTLVLNLNQAAINAIRSVGATSQYIFVEGNSWTGAWSWVANNDNLKALTDPQGKLIYQMHQYLDSDSSGTNEACVSGTIGAERLSSATKWLRDNKKVGILGEFAGGPNSQCLSAVTGVLDHLKANSDVWQGGLWWAAGPWWDAYMFSFEPPSGKGYLYYNSLLKSYAP